MELQLKFSTMDDNFTMTCIHIFR